MSAVFAILLQIHVTAILLSCCIASDSDSDSDFISFPLK